MKKNGILTVQAVVLAVCASSLSVAMTQKKLRPKSPENTLRECFRNADYERAVVVIEEELERKPDDPFWLYNAACAKSMLDDADTAASLLMESVKNGYRNFSHIRRDPDLDAIRDHQIYRALLDARDFADQILSQRRVSHWRNELGKETYRQYEADALNVDFVTSLDPVSQSDVCHKLIDHATLLIDRHFDESPRHRVVIVLPKEEDKHMLMFRGEIEGVYRHDRRELISLDTTVALRHEFVHALHQSQMDRLGQEHPIWIQEGLATLWEDYERVDGHSVLFHAGDRHNLIKELQRDENLIPWNDLFQYSSSMFHTDAARAYAQVHSMFRFIAERSDVDEWYQLYVKGFRDDPSGRYSLETVFEQPITHIEQQWKSWLTAQPTFVTQNMVISKSNVNGKSVDSTEETSEELRDSLDRIMHEGQ